MESEIGCRDVTWPDYVSVGAQMRQEAGAIVCPLVMEDGETCFAVRLGQRWLCGSRGCLTFFHSLAAARRFLRLIHVDDIAFGMPQPVPARNPERYQCFRLAGLGLTTCGQCRIGTDSCRRELQETEQLEEPW